MGSRLRETEISRIRARLLRIGFPRLRMLLLIAVTGCAGLLASYLMLRAGLLSMPLRYALALLAAYGVFLLLVRGFVRRGDVSDLDLPANPFGHRETQTAIPTPAHDGDSTSGDWLGDFRGGDEAALVLLLVVVIVVIAFASLWIVVSAPTLFAELAIDAALSAGLYRRLRKIETRHWLETAVRHTIWPFLGTAVALVAFAAVAQHLRPHAHSIGDVLSRPTPAETTAR